MHKAGEGGIGTLLGAERREVKAYEMDDEPTIYAAHDADAAANALTPNAQVKGAA